MRDLDLVSLRLFVAVCDAGSIARAAQEQHIVASAISKRVMQLEQDVGATLLQRRRRGVAVTPAGETLLEHARAMLASAQRIHEDMAAHGKGVRGHVRILGAISAVAEFLPDDVAAFLRDPDHRDIQIDIEEGTSKQVVLGVREGRASLGVCWDDADFMGLETTPCRTDHLAMVVPSGHPLASAQRIAFAATLAFEQVGLPAASSAQVMFQRAAAKAGLPLRYRTTVSGFDAALRVVAAGLAISVVPREIACQHAVASRLRIIALTDAWAQRTFAICHRGQSSLSPAAQALVAHLVRPQGTARARPVVLRG